MCGRYFDLAWGADVQMFSPYSLLRSCDSKTTSDISVSWKQIFMPTAKTKRTDRRIKIHMKETQPRGIYFPFINGDE